jgi:FdhE protein
VGAEYGLSQDAVAFLACASLRPHLEALLAGCRDHLGESEWELGACPFCGGPAGFAEIVEDGRRRLACHLCGGAWFFPRLRCPFCGNPSTRDLGRLEPEGQEQGYFISVCKACRAYVKELDRRERWNGGPALVEDWGSPHLDLVASREGYWRPAAPLVCLAGSASGGYPPAARSTSSS